MGTRRGNALVSMTAAEHRRRPSARSPPAATGLQTIGHSPQRSGTHFMASPLGEELPAGRAAQKGKRRRANIASSQRRTAQKS